MVSLDKSQTYAIQNLVNDMHLFKGEWYRIFEIA